MKFAAAASVGTHEVSKIRDTMFLNELYSDRWIKKKSEPEVHVLPPRQLNSNQLELIRRLIVSGGQVVGGIQSTLRGAKLIAFVTIDDEIVSVQVLKSPEQDYINSIFAHAGIDSTGYDTEIGYAFTKPDYRSQGFSSKMIDSLLRSHRGKLYATVREQNRDPQRLLARFGFKRAGTPFVGPSGATLVLWVR